MFQIVAINIVQIGFGELGHNVGGGYIPIMAGQAVILFRQIIQKSLAVASRVWIVAVVAGLIYHSLAGVKHLVADFGVGETMEGGVLGARIVIALSVVLILLAGVWIW